MFTGKPTENLSEIFLLLLYEVVNFFNITGYNYFYYSHALLMLFNTFFYQLITASVMNSTINLILRWEVNTYTFPLFHCIHIRAPKINFCYFKLKKIFARFLQQSHKFY